MKIIVISLARAIDRREKIKKQLDRLNLDYILMDAVDGNLLSDDQKNRYISLNGGWRYGEKFMPGEIGCTMSHINAIKLAKENKFERFIVFEDDITICDDFEKRIKLLERMLHSSWEHVYLSGIPRIAPLPSYLMIANVVKSSFTQQTHSMLIRDTAYDKIINMLETFKTTTDDMYCDAIEHGKLNSYTYYPFVTHVNSTYSYIWDKPAGTNFEFESKAYYKARL